MVEPFRRKTSFVLAAALAVGVSAALSPAAAQKKTRVTVAVTETIASVSPYADSVSLMYAIYADTLGNIVDWDYRKGRYVSHILESWKVIDPTTWELKIKPGLKRHNGEPVVSADIAHSVHRAKTDANSKQKHNVKFIKEVLTPDPRTAIVKTTQPVAPMQEFFSRVIVTSKAQYDKLGPNADKEAPFGYGPYKIKQVAVDNYFAMEKVPGHPAVKPGNPDEIVYKIIKEPESRVTALLNGEVQIAQFIPPQLVPRVKSSTSVRLEWSDSIEIMFLAMSPKHKPWDKKEARQAVAYAIDRDALIRVLLQGQASKLNGPIGPGQIGYDPNFPVKYEYNPKKAKELLAKAGYPNGVEIDYYTPVGRYTADKQISEAMVPMLQAAGFKVNLKTPEWGTLWSNVQKGQTPFYYMGRGSVVDPSAALTQYFETGGSPRIGFSNAEVDKYLQAERQEFDEAKRKVLLNKAMAKITEEAPAHFMWRHKLATGVSNRIAFTAIPSQDVRATDIVVKPGRKR
ncbi:MAG: ABC transporter substrate-binding protein [Hyphomicrobiaceae bacterium]